MSAGNKKSPLSTPFLALFVSIFGLLVFATCANPEGNDRETTGPEYFSSNYAAAQASISNRH